MVKEALNRVNWLFYPVNQLPQRRGVVIEHPALVKRVYCQGCGVELTYNGGVISTTGSIYCNDIWGSVDSCFDKEILPMMRGDAPKRSIGFNYANPKRVQESISEYSLVNFGPLERKV